VLVEFERVDQVSLLGLVRLHVYMNLPLFLGALQ
jgi:hypothetical protein